MWSAGRSAAALGVLVAGLVAASSVLIPRALSGAPSASAAVTAVTTAGPAGGDAFVPVRAALLVSGRAVSAGSPLVLPVAGHGGVPASGVAAVVIEVQVTGAAKAGTLVAYPAGAVRPGTASLSYAAATAVSQLMVVPPGSGGGVDLAVSAGSA